LHPTLEKLLRNKSLDLSDKNVCEFLAALNDWFCDRSDQGSPHAPILEAVFESSTDGILVVDREGQMEQFNQRLCELWGFAADDVRAHPPTELLTRVTAQLADADTFLAPILEIPRTPALEIRDTFEFRDGRVYERFSSPYRIGGRGAGRIWRFRDVTEQTRQQRVIQHQAMHDGLTGLPNRDLLEDRLEQAIGTAQRTGKYLAVFFVDLDRFKVVNDSLGHAVGDALLCEVGRRLNARCRRGDTVARIGGDEFIAFVGNLDQEEDAMVVARGLMQALQPPIEHNGLVLHATASVGISLFPKDADSKDALIRRADNALYEAKEQGRNTYRFFEAQAAPESGESLQLEQDLRVAVNEGAFQLHFQPQVAVSNGSLSGVEALLRWKRPDGTSVAPGRFVPIAEHAGLIGQLGDWVLDEGARQIAEWNRRGLGLEKISLNVSGYQLYRPEFSSRLLELITQLGVEPQRIVLEITETVLLNHLDKSAQTLLQLRDHGVRIAMDDFGTGHSSLSQLQSLPIDQLKIDRTFIEHCHDDYAAHAILTSIVSMAHSLSMEVVAEGVENREQFHALYGAKCDAVQGFLFSKPMDAAGLERWLLEPAILTETWNRILDV